MNKYMILYLAPIDAWQQMANNTPEQAQKEMALWEAWFGKNGSAIVEQGSPFGNVKNITQSGSTERQTKAAGYSVLQAADMDSIQSMLGDHPHFGLEGGTIEVLEFMSMG